MFRPSQCGLAALCASLSPLHAMDFATAQNRSGLSTLIMVGMIIPGDTNKLAAFLALKLDAKSISFAVMNSDGGSVAEAMALANLVRAKGWGVGVGDGSMCASACFLLFAAGVSKYAMLQALIGVHSASLNGLEDTGALASTVVMARDAAAFGMPS